MAKPMNTLELHYSMIQVLILTIAHDTTSVKLHYNYGSALNAFG